jgi:hypothetical protein
MYALNIDVDFPNVTPLDDIILTSRDAIAELSKEEIITQVYEALVEGPAKWEAKEVENDATYAIHEHYKGLLNTLLEYLDGTGKKTFKINAMAELIRSDFDL